MAKGWKGDSERHSFASRGVNTRNKLTLYESDGEAVFLFPTHNQEYPIVKIYKDLSGSKSKNPDVSLIHKKLFRPTPKLIDTIENKSFFGYRKRDNVLSWYNPDNKIELRIKRRVHGDIYSGKYILLKWRGVYGRDLWGANTIEDLYPYLYMWAYLYTHQSERSYRDMMVDILNKMYKEGLIERV